MEDGPGIHQVKNVLLEEEEKMCAIRKTSSGRGLQADAALPFSAAKPRSQAAGAPLHAAAPNLALSVPLG